MVLGCKEVPRRAMQVLQRPREITGQVTGWGAGQAGGSVPQTVMGELRAAAAAGRRLQLCLKWRWDSDKRKAREGEVAFRQQG